MRRWEDACARLCLATCAAWDESMPTPMTRYAVNRILNNGFIEGMVIRHEDELGEDNADRMKRLLSRARAVCELMSRYEEDGYTLLLPGDEHWPGRLTSMGLHAPLFLFAKGNPGLLGNRCIAVAGSRSILPETAAWSRRLGQRLAEEGVCVVSGGAAGVDHAAQNGAFASGGGVIIIPARPAAEILREYETEMSQGRLLVLCDTLPDEPFTPQKALIRNHTIYALGESAVVAAARAGMGGSWRGAADCLQEGWTPVFVPSGSSPDLTGCQALLERGARLLPEEDKLLIRCLFSTEKQICLF